MAQFEQVSNGKMSCAHSVDGDGMTFINKMPAPSQRFENAGPRLRIEDCAWLALGDALKSWRMERLVCSDDGFRLVTRQSEGNLTVRVNRAEFTTSIEIVSQPCHLGGFRYWLRCPNCGRRATRLALMPTNGRLKCLGCGEFDRNFMRRTNSRARVENLEAEIKRLRSLIGEASARNPTAHISREG